MDSKSDIDPALRGYDAWLGVVRNYQKCHRVMTCLLAPLGLSVAQHEMLMIIGQREGLTQQELADSLLVVKSNVTALLGRMEQQGLVEREPDPGDARVRRIRLTREGRALRKRSFSAQARVVEKMMETLDDRELALNQEFNRRVSAALDGLLESG